MSDGPTHFKKETLRILTKSLHAPHHFTIPYCTWSNGAVERLGRELLRIVRAIPSELRLRPEKWPDILPIFQSALNNAPSRHRDNKAPITASMGMNPSSPIKIFLDSSTGTPTPITDIAYERSANITGLQDCMEALHPKIATALSNNLERSRQSAQRGKPANFHEGDFVLVARELFHEGEKLCLRWRGPRRVIKEVSNWVYLVEDLRNGELCEVHATRLKYYSDSSLDSTAILPHVLSSETGMQIQRLLKLIDSTEGTHVIVRWKGLTPNEDTEEPIQNIHDDVPHLLGKLLARKTTSPILAAKARHELGISSGGL